MKRSLRGKAAPAETTALDRRHGRVTAAHGRHYVVEADDGETVLCFPRGKKSEIAVGDEVAWARTGDQGVIEEILPRRNLLYRSDQFKSKLFAANIDQLVIMLGTEPYFSEDLLGRALVASEANALRPLIVLNKTDVADALPAARERLAPYRALGYDVLELSVRADPEGAKALLLPRLAHQASLLLGQSGMGKSSLVNLLVPDADAATREISTVLNSGKHTTTFTRIFHLPEGGLLIDSPGFQEFGLHHLKEGALERAFPEFRARLTGCRFYNCHHLKEPGCAILAAVSDGSISQQRHMLYAQLVHESEQQIPY
ncbi:ribosome small subunit-dependent GTPase A [Pandoraea soli]|uniref:Small ribosomal subunit biogenesis GTPase RsgA n=1 Tax=Pandoraea soli TaxID=2508293 RepID=A0ABY6VWH4_9BURK|nr:ribosome small subunit-dependent GTPase A [Pandoraea soli]VVD96144.1 ribosome small subunit-dependent GTPase A [Pandoraea soli]